MNDISALLNNNDTTSDNVVIEEYKDKASQLKANLGWVYAVNQAISDDCGAVKLKLFKKKKDGDLEEIYEHEVLDLLDNPNNLISSKQMWSLHYSYLNLTGESYILKLDKKGEPLTDRSVLPSALFPLPSHLCTFVIGKTSFEDSYVQYGTKKYPIQAIIRDINPDPENPYFGMSVVRKASLTVDTDIQMKRWNNKLFKNGARPGAVIEIPDRMSNEDFKRFKQEFDEAYGGTSNVFRRIILEGGAKITPYMLNASELDFLESKRFTRDEVLAMFRTSGSSIGITEDVNRANAEAQEYQYAKRIIKPRLEQFIDIINSRVLKPIYGNDIVVGFEDVVPEDRTQKLNEANLGVNKWFTIDEVREMYGYEPLPDGAGAQLYVPISSIPISAVASISDDSEEDDDSNDTNDGNKPNDTSTPPDEGNNNNDTDNQDTGKSSPKVDEKRIVIGEQKVKAHTRTALAYEKQILRKSRKMFNAQKKDVIAWLDNHYGEKGFDIDLNKKAWGDDMVNWEEYNKGFSGELNKLLQLIIDEIGTEAYNALVNDGGFDPYALSIQSYINDTSLKVAKGVNAETEKQIRATLASGIRDNEGISELKARVSQVFGSASTYRAYMIAVTEVATAQNTADVEAWQQTGVVEGKEWYTARDEITCEFCGSMDLKYKQLTENFFMKGDAHVVNDHIMKLDYRDIGEPPLHPHCRCTVLPVLKQQ